jgi:phage protein D
MDREEKSAEHPAQSDAVIARKIIASYPQYGLLPNVIDPPSARVPSLVDHVPTQQQTDLGHLRMMAERHGYVFYVTPGEAPGMNVAYWGPPQRSGVVQRAITANMGSASNVESVNFHYDALASTLYAGEIKDARAGHASIRTYVSSRIPQLAILPAILFDRAGIRTNQYRVSGPDIADAQARAQALTDASTDRVLTATGELDAARYGDLLRPRALVGLRGAGFSFDGVYYVKSVSHTLMRGAYKQQFTLTREGKGSTVSTVRQ